MSRVIRSQKEQAILFEAAWSGLREREEWFHFSTYPDLFGLMNHKSVQTWRSAFIPDPIESLGPRVLRDWSQRQNVHAMDLITTDDPGIADFLAVARDKYLKGVRLFRVQGLPETLQGDRKSEYLKYLDAFMGYQNVPTAGENVYNMPIGERSNLYDRLRALEGKPEWDIMIFGNRLLMRTELSSEGIVQRTVYDRDDPDDITAIDAALGFRDAVFENVDETRRIKSQRPSRPDMSFDLGVYSPTGQADISHISRVGQLGEVHLGASRAVVVGNGPDICVVDRSADSERLTDEMIAHWAKFLWQRHSPLFNMRTVIFADSDPQAACHWAEGRRHKRHIEVLDMSLPRRPIEPDRFTSLSKRHVIAVLYERSDSLLSAAVRVMKQLPPEVLDDPRVSGAARKMLERFDFTQMSVRDPLSNAEKAQRIYQERLRTVVDAAREFADAVQRHPHIDVAALRGACDSIEEQINDPAFDVSEPVTEARVRIASLEVAITQTLGMGYWTGRSLGPPVLDVA